jgi:dephospho-CoA kinase
MIRVVVVTGGIATGKSLVCRLLGQALGSPVCSCDEIVHRLLGEADVVAQIAERFPSAVTSSGEVLLRELAAIVFTSETRRRELEALLHPMVLAGVQEWVAANRIVSRIGVLEVPLLYEVDFPIKRDVDMVVACSERTQIQRLALREGSSVQAGNRIGAQMPLSEKILRADVVIWNEGSLGTLTRLVALAARGIHQKLQ